MKVTNERHEQEWGHFQANLLKNEIPGPHSALTRYRLNQDLKSSLTPNWKNWFLEEDLEFTCYFQPPVELDYPGNNINFYSQMTRGHFMNKWCVADYDGTFEGVWQTPQGHLSQIVPYFCEVAHWSDAYWLGIGAAAATSVLF